MMTLSVDTISNNYFIELPGLSQDHTSTYEFLHKTQTSVYSYIAILMNLLSGDEKLLLCE